MGPRDRPPDRYPELQAHYDAVYDRLTGGRTARAVQPLLDVGAGDGAALAATVAGTGVRGVALDQRLVLDWRGPLGFAPLQADAARLPFRDRAFTATLSMETLEWFADPPAALREMARVSQDAVVLVQSEWGSLWFDSGDPDTAREFTRLFSGPGAPAGRRLAGLVTGAGMQVASESTDTIRGERLQRGTYAFELLRILREYLVVQRSGVRARRFDEWRDDLVERAARGAFSFSLERHVVVGRPPAS